MKKILLMSLILSATSYTQAQIVLGGDGVENSKPVRAGEMINQNNSRNGLLKGSDSESSKNIAKGSSANVLSPNKNIGEPTITISKREYEEDLKRRGITQEQDLERAKSLEVGNDGIIRSDVDFVTKSNGISIFEAQRLQIKQEIEEAKQAAKIESVEDNGKYFFENAMRNINKSQGVIDSIEKDMLYGKINLIQYDRLDKQIEMMNVLLEAASSKEIDEKANQLKTRIYTLMRQMYPFIWEENIRGVKINSFGLYHKTLKVFSPSMDSSEVLKLKAILDSAFIIGYERVIFTNQRGYAVEETVKDYIKKIKEEKDKKFKTPKK